MVTLLTGKKGSGKTKKLIALANEAVTKSNGNVVVIEKGLKMTYDIAYQARLVDVEVYNIEGLDMMSGFISGICAGNFDVTDILIDSTLKIIGEDKDDVLKFVTKMDELSKKCDITIVLSISAAEEDLPSQLWSFAQKA